jgi:hypothetical protein
MSASRFLPERRARLIANRILAEEEDFPESIEPDDAAAAEIDDATVDLPTEAHYSDDDILDVEQLGRIDDTSPESSISSESDSSDNILSAGPSVDGTMISANGTTWEIIQPGHRVGRASSRNVFNVPNQGLRIGLHPQSYEESFLVFFEDILSEVVLYTNLEGRRVASARGIAWKPVTLVEIKAFIGLLMIAGEQHLFLSIYLLLRTYALIYEINTSPYVALFKITIKSVYRPYHSRESKIENLC